MTISLKPKQFNKIGKVFQSFRLDFCHRNCEKGEFFGLPNQQEQHQTNIIVEAKVNWGWYKSKSAADYGRALVT